MSAKTGLLAMVIAGACLPATAAESYTIDPNHTFPSMEMPHFGISTWRGKFNKTAGKVTLDREARTGTVEIEVDTTSIDWGHEKMNEKALTAEWLDVANFPVMTYKGTLSFTGDTPTAVDGHLTLRGVTKPLKLKMNGFKCIVHPLNKKPVCGADAEGELHRGNFGMTKFAEGQAGMVQLRIQVEAFKDQPTAPLADSY